MKKGKLLTSELIADLEKTINEMDPSISTDMSTTESDLFDVLMGRCPPSDCHSTD